MLKKGTDNQRREYWRAFCRTNPEKCNRARERNERNRLRSLRATWGDGSPIGSGELYRAPSCPIGSDRIDIAVAPGAHVIVDSTYDAGGDPGVEIQLGAAVATLKKNGPSRFGPAESGESGATLVVIGRGTRLQACDFASGVLRFEDSTDSDWNEPVLSIAVADSWQALSEWEEADRHYKEAEVRARKRMKDHVKWFGAPLDLCPIAVMVCTAISACRLLNDGAIVETNEEGGSDGEPEAQYGCIWDKRERVD